MTVLLTNDDGFDSPGYLHPINHKEDELYRSVEYRR